MDGIAYEVEMNLSAHSTLYQLFVHFLREGDLKDTAYHRDKVYAGPWLHSMVLGSGRYNHTAQSSSSAYYPYPDSHWTESGQAYGSSRVEGSGLFILNLGIRGRVFSLG